MIEYRLGGEVSSALSHLMLVGLASILEEGGVREVRFAWSADRLPRPLLWTDLDETEAALAVRDHAERHTEPGSWVSAVVASGVRKGSGLFSPRVEVPHPTTGAAEWAEYEQQREAVLSRGSTTLSDLDHRMLSALGEPAWWRCDGRNNQPDLGASRWEMKTRNRGEEFITHRLRPIARAVVGRSPEAVWSGLSGATLVDEAGGGPDSRSSTGLTPPGPADNAQVWCALWGLSVLPTVHTASERVASGHSQSPGTFPRNRVHPVRASLPAFTEPTTVAHFRAICTSAHFDVLVNTASDVDPVARSQASAWLKEQGVRAVVAFPVNKVGSSSAPERQLLTGRIEVL